PAAWGKNKKEAEQQAACNAWNILMAESSKVVESETTCDSAATEAPLHEESPPHTNNETPPGVDKNESEE
ncbi:MAG: hypothetical protein D6741_12170, partial [Planctomycetota bacterium]